MPEGLLIHNEVLSNAVKPLKM